jgi:hypothetical protein
LSCSGDRRRRCRCRCLGSGAARWSLRAGYVVTSFGVSSLVALSLFGRWEGRIEAGTTYPMPGVDALSFSSPRAAAYEQAAQASAEKVLPAHAAGLAPREGEEVIIAEADPQGRQVATKMRGSLYRLLEEVLGQDAVVLRTIAGDVTSNGTVAERSFVPAEAAASGDVPTVAVKGDHDSPETVDQSAALARRCRTWRS